MTAEKEKMRWMMKMTVNSMLDCQAWNLGRYRVSIVAVAACYLGGRDDAPHVVTLVLHD